MPIAVKTSKMFRNNKKPTKFSNLSVSFIDKELSYDHHTLGSWRSIGGNDMPEYGGHQATPPSL